MPEGRRILEAPKRSDLPAVLGAGRLRPHAAQVVARPEPSRGLSLLGSLDGCAATSRDSTSRQTCTDVRPPSAGPRGFCSRRLRETPGPEDLKAPTDRQLTQFPSTLIGIETHDFVVKVIYLEITPRQPKWKGNYMDIGRHVLADQRRAQLPPARMLQSTTLLHRMDSVVSSCSNDSFVIVATARKASLFTADGVFIRHLDNRVRGAVTNVAITAAGSQAAIGYSSRWVELLDLKSTGVSHSFRTRCLPRLLHFLPDGTLAVAGTKRIERYDLQQVRPLAERVVHPAALLASSARHELYALSKKRELSSVSLETLALSRSAKINHPLNSLMVSRDGSVLMGTRRTGAGTEVEWLDGAYLRYFGRTNLQETSGLFCAVRATCFLICHGRRAVVMNPAHPEKAEERYDLPLTPAYVATLDIDRFLAQDEDDDVWVVRLPAPGGFATPREEPQVFTDTGEFPSEVTDRAWGQLKDQLAHLLAAVEERYRMRMAVALNAADFRRIRAGYDDELLEALIRFRGALRDAGILNVSLDDKLSETYEKSREGFLVDVEGRVRAKEIIP